MTSGANFIDDPRAWRVSKSGFSIRTGWADDKQILGQYSGPRSPMDNEAFRRWFETAEQICELYNSTLSPPPVVEEAKCVKCEHGETDANGWCMTGRPYIANEPDSNQRSICPCYCVFPTATPADKCKHGVESNAVCELCDYDAADAVNITPATGQEQGGDEVQNHSGDAAQNLGVPRAESKATPALGAALSFGDAVKIARGCHDYGGGHHSDGHMEAYQHGIQTVVQALGHAEKDGLQSYQIAVLHSVGSIQDTKSSEASHSPERGPDSPASSPESSSEPAPEGSPEPMKRCAKCGNLFRYPPSDNKESATTCAWCVAAREVITDKEKQDEEFK